MSYLKSKFMTTVYLLSNIVLYVLLIGYFESIKFTLGIVFIGVLSFIVYYVADIFAVEGASKSKNLIYSTIINALLAVLMIFKTSRIDGFTFYLCMYIYQISVKSFIIKFAVKKKNILIIGDNYKNEIIRSILKKHNKLFRIIGTISANEGRCDRDDCLGTTEQLKEIVRNKKIDLIINLEENIKNKSFINQLLDLKVGGVQVYDYLSFYEIIEEKIPIKSINEEWFLFGYGFNILHNSYQQKEKRIFDVIISSVIIILTFPIMLIAALIVKLESKGSVLFIQERIGKGNIPFNIYKFRSMRSDAEKDGPQWAKKK